MVRSTFSPKMKLAFGALACIAVASCAILAAQTDTTTTLTPAQQKAQAAKAARQAAAQQAAENRAAAAQARAAAAQNKKAPQNTASNSVSPNSSATLPPNTPANPSRPGSATTPAAAQKIGSAGTVGSGTLAWQTRVYSSTGCQHNGNSAVCTFTFANQGNAATLVAGGELQGIQLVDDAHVPHHANSAHFLDKYGTQQSRLLVQPGDTGTYVVTFPDVNSQVTSADFHLRQQVVGGITFSSSNSAATSAAGKSSPASAGATPK